MTRKDGTVAGLCHHWDDEPESVGRCLLDQYSDPHKLEELIAHTPHTAPTIASDVEGFCGKLRRSGCKYFYLFDITWSVSKPYGRWRALADVMTRGVELLVEPDPDRGPDMQWARGETRSTWLVWPTSKMGRQWMHDFEGDVDGLELDDEELAGDLEEMRRDGLIVERQEPQP
jgi:hypothetical protein